MREVLIEFNLPGEPLSLNKMPATDGSARAWRRQKNEWKNAAFFATCAAFPGAGPEGRRMPPCDVRISIPFGERRTRDPHNYFPTVKVIADAIVLAGVWPDDNPEFVTTHEPDLRIVPKEKIWKSRVYVRLIPRLSTPDESSESS